jgi:predicted DNA binding CopG/RHH family protein
MTNKEMNIEKQIEELKQRKGKSEFSSIQAAFSIINQLQEQNKNQAQTIKTFREDGFFGEFEDYKLKEHDDWNVRLEEKGGDLVIIKKAVFMSQLKNFFRKMKSPSKTTLKQIDFLNKYDK